MQFYRKQYYDFPISGKGVLYAFSYYFGGKKIRVIFAPSYIPRMKMRRPRIIRTVGSAVIVVIKKTKTGDKKYLFVFVFICVIHESRELVSPFSFVEKQYIDETEKNK